MEKFAVITKHSASEFEKAINEFHKDNNVVKIDFRPVAKKDSISHIAYIYYTPKKKMVVI